MLLSLAAYYLFSLSLEENADGTKSEPTATAIALLCVLVALDLLLTVTAFVCTLEPLVERGGAKRNARRVYRSVVLSTLAPLVTTFVSYGVDRLAA